MGGGSFDYAFNRLVTFADELEQKLDDELHPGNAEVRLRLRRLVSEARRLAPIMKEAEWLYSGDTGEDTFLRRVGELDAR